MYHHGKKTECEKVGTPNAKNLDRIESHININKSGDMGRQLFLSRIIFWVPNMYTLYRRQASNQLIQPEGPASSISLVIP